MDLTVEGMWKSAVVSQASDPQTVIIRAGAPQEVVVKLKARCADVCPIGKRDCESGAVRMVGQDQGAG